MEKLITFVSPIFAWVISSPDFFSSACSTIARSAGAGMSTGSAVTVDMYDMKIKNRIENCNKVDTCVCS